MSTLNNSTATSPPKSLVLIVDDQAANLQLAASVLSPYYHLLLADNGQKALEVAAAKRPDLILLDVMMPGLSGYETCRQLKANTATCHIPVIFLTAKTEEKEIQEAFEAGGQDYITKPFKAKEVLARIKLHISLQQHHAFKEKLISIISHDLQEPLRNIIGIMELVEQNQQVLGKEDIIQYCSLLKERARLSAALLANLLEWSKSQAEAGTELRQPVNLSSELEGVLLQLGRMAESKNILIKRQLDPQIKVLAHATMLQTILRNLLSNSIKFTQPGNSITISATRQGNTIEIAVADPGIGIKPERIEKLLSKTNSDWSYGTNKETGSGLGLNLCLDLIGQLGGKLHIESEPGKGSTFRFSLPAAL